MKFLIAILLLLTCSFAQDIERLQDFNQFHFEDAFEKTVLVPKDTKIILVTFDQKGNTIASEYLNKQSKNFYLEKNLVYIGDIHKMPSLVTYMFARPKMQKYNFTIYLFNESGLDKVIPYRKGKITILEFDEQSNLVNIHFEENLEKFFNKSFLKETTL